MLRHWSCFLGSLLVTALAACADSSGGNAAGGSADITASRPPAVPNASPQLAYGKELAGTLSSKSDEQTYTFLAMQGWSLDFFVDDGPGKPSSPFSVAPAFAAHATVTFNGQTVAEATGDMKTTGNAIGNLQAPATGTYTLVVSAGDTDGVSPLDYKVSVSPPNNNCNSDADCQVVLDGKTIDTGLVCQPSFDDEDGKALFCLFKN